MAALSEDQKDIVKHLEFQWQRDKLPEKIRDLVLDDQRLRNDSCWFVLK